MLEQEIIGYYRNWNKKIRLIKGKGPKDIFDRFISLYPIQNKLYRKASEALISKGVINSDGGDKRSATENLVTYLGADIILNEFIAKGNRVDIDHLIQLLDNRVFNIILTKKCESIQGADQALLAEIRSVDNGIKITAILKLIYHVRCNYVHGCKDFHEYQTLLLEPINNLLTTLNSLLFDTLNK